MGIFSFNIAADLSGAFSNSVPVTCILIRCYKWAKSDASKLRYPGVWITHKISPIGGVMPGIRHCSSGCPRQLLCCPVCLLTGFLSLDRGWSWQVEADLGPLCISLPVPPPNVLIACSIVRLRILVTHWPNEVSEAVELKRSY